MKKTALNYIVNCKSFIDEINSNNLPLPIQEGIINALDYIQSRKVNIEWTNIYGIKMSTHMVPNFKIRTPKIPEKIVLYTTGSLKALIQRINNCLDEIQTYDNYQDCMKDNETIVKVKEIFLSERSEVFNVARPKLQKPQIIGRMGGEMEINPREVVFKAIDSERDYQDKLTKNDNYPEMKEDFQIADGLSAIKVNLSKAHDSWYSEGKPYNKTMDYLRKIAGICAKVGERYGMSLRESDAEKKLMETIPKDASKPMWKGKLDTLKNAHGFDMVKFAADLLYYKVNPNTKMDIPNDAYIQAEKAVKRYLETGTTKIKGWCKAKKEKKENKNLEGDFNDFISLFFP